MDSQFNLSLKNLNWPSLTLQDMVDEQGRVHRLLSVLINREQVNLHTFSDRFLEWFEDPHLLRHLRQQVWGCTLHSWLWGFLVGKYWLIFLAWGSGIFIARPGNILTCSVAWSSLVKWYAKPHLLNDILKFLFWGGGILWRVPMPVRRLVLTWSDQLKSRHCRHWMWVPGQDDDWSWELARIVNGFIMISYDF